MTSQIPLQMFELTGPLGTVQCFANGNKFVNYFEEYEENPGAYTKPIQRALFNSEREAMADAKIVTGLCDVNLENLKDNG